MAIPIVGRSRSEAAFQRALIKAYDGWAEGVHPTNGMKTGVPDTLFLDPHDVLVPIELKVGKVENGKLVVKEIRPAQRRWARKFRKAGGKSGFLVGVPIGRHWVPFLLPWEVAVKGKQEYKLEVVKVMDTYVELFVDIKEGFQKP